MISREPRVNCEADRNGAEPGKTESECIMSNIRIGHMTLGIYQTNCYFVYREDSDQALVFDPADHGEKIEAALEQHGLHTAAILLTHGHFDHISGCEELKTAADAFAKERGTEQVKIYAGEAEKKFLLDTKNNLSKAMGRPVTVMADVYLKDGEELDLDGIRIRVLATPGHTAGGVSYYFPEGGLLICGDTLFQESVGRTDFPTGSMSELVRSVKEKLFTLPEETVVYPGHGDSTTIGHEKKYNPFCVE